MSIATQKGPFILVDPNPPNNEIISQEDMFIYVKFSAYPRSRSTYGVQNSSDLFDVNDEVNFISTEIRYGSNGKLDPSLQKTYATSNWSSIGGFTNTKSRGALEGFGIKSIEIKYNASLVPVVDITFTDVRGSALFDVIKDDDRSSPYSIFFKMPYPVFRLSVKGYFGQTVDYCLHMVNWTSNFDGSTGNFDISANFLGFQQAFLNDMNIGNIIGAVNTPEGQEALKNLNWVIDNDNVINNEYRKLDDFLLKISKLQINSEIYKAELNSFETLKQLNGQLGLLKNISSWIGKPITKRSFDTNKNVDYLNLENDTKQIITTSVSSDSGLLSNNQYLSIRDYILVNQVNLELVKTFFKNLNNVVNTYKEYSNNITNKKIETTKNDEFINSFYEITNEDNYINFIINKSGSKIETLQLSTVFKNMGEVKDSPYYLIKNYGDKNNNNNNFEINYFNEQYKYFYNNRINENTSVLIIDLRKQRELTENIILDLESKIKIQKEIVQKELNLQINDNFRSVAGFDPKINSCIKVITNNTQAMIQTVYKVTEKAEKVDKNFRNSVLRNLETDVEPNVLDGRSIGWPSIYQRKGNGSFEEIYIGEVINQGDWDNFPEYRFVENVFSNLINKKKILNEVTSETITTNNLDKDNWFPINPIDYSEAPFIKINSKTTESDINNEFVKQVLLRMALLGNYSKWTNEFGGNSPSDYAQLDALTYMKSIVDGQVKNINYNFINNLDINNITQTKYFKDNLEIVNDYIRFKEDKPLEFGNIKISGYRNKFDTTQYILFDNEGILNNNKKLNSDIVSNKKYKEIVDKKQEDKYFTTFYDKTNNLTSNISCGVWDLAVCERLIKTNKNLKLSFSINSINDIENKETSENVTNQNSSENVTDENSTKQDILYANQKNSNYINKTNFYLTGKNSKCGFDDYMIQSDLYKKQSGNDKYYKRALLLLSTLPFRPFKKTIIENLFKTGYNNSRIINLPKYYVYLLGGYLWRAEKDVNIDFNVDFSGISECNYTIFSSSNKNYLTNLGYLATVTDYQGKELPLEDELLNLPISVKNNFIKQFKDWADLNFNQNMIGNVEFTFSKYANDESISLTTYQEYSNKVKNLLSQTTNMIVTTPQIFDKTALNNGLIIDSKIFDEYIKSFKSTLNNPYSYEQSKPTTEVEIEKQNKTNNKIKLQIYNYFKNISDKWAVDTDGDGRAFNICSDENGDLYDYFKIIDRGWRDIGNIATFNLKSFLTLSSNFDNSVYFFISKLLRDSNFLFQILPNYVNFKDVNEAGKIFKPMTTVESNSSSSPTFLCVYVGGNSQLLDIGERHNHYFKNDGFSLEQPPPDMMDETSKNSLVGFRVAFGAQNQTIFKNVSLSQQEHRETGEYFKAIGELVDKRGGTQKSYQGTDLLKIFKTRSYTCKVDALGCMNIQPMMYFDLQNVPFFNGAYMITSVNHSISPNHMTTSFQGVRQSKFIAPPVDDLTADLNFDFNETSEVPKIQYISLPSNNGLYSIGTKNPTEVFKFTEKFTYDNFKKLGVTNPAINQDVITLFSDFLVEKVIVTNAQVTMFLANVLTQSNNLSSNEYSWDVADKENYRLKFPADSPMSGQTIYYGVDPNEKDKNLSLPKYSSGTDNNIAYELPNNIELSDSKYGNKYDGDAYRFRPRGYLYVIGRNNYFDYYNGSAYIINPDGITLNPESSFIAAVNVWLKQKDSNGNTADYYSIKTDSGKSSDFAQTINSVQQFGKRSIEDNYRTFEKVLTVFELLDLNRP